MKTRLQLVTLPRFVVTFLLLTAAVYVLRRIAWLDSPIEQKRPPSASAGAEVARTHLPQGNLTVSVDRLRLPNTLRTQYDKFAAAQLSSVVSRQATAADPQLIQLIRHLIDPPSTRPMAKLSPALVVHSPQSTVVDQLLKNRKNGFFVEAGAYDGSEGSNTLYFEQKLNWTGLLVEPDPCFYNQLLGKSRRSWSINAGLSLQTYVTQMGFDESEGQLGKLNSNKALNSSTDLLPCFPLSALLRALNIDKVDFFSLDVEGFEFEVLTTIDFAAVDITAISVEYEHSKHSKDEFISYMATQGYRMHKNIQFYQPSPFVYAQDFLFVKNS